MTFDTSISVVFKTYAASSLKIVSVQFSTISSIVLRGKVNERPAWKHESWSLTASLQLMDGERRWSGSEFQTTGAVMLKKKKKK